MKLSSQRVLRISPLQGTLSEDMITLFYSVSVCRHSLELLWCLLVLLVSYLSTPRSRFRFLDRSISVTYGWKGMGGEGGSSISTRNVLSWPPDVIRRFLWFFRSRSTDHCAIFPNRSLNVIRGVEGEGEEESSENDSCLMCTIGVGARDLSFFFYARKLV